MRALVLSGGASKGAYQIGALKYLINDLGTQYDILCGVSVGALNCAHLSMYTKDQQKNALTNLINVWETISTSSVRKNWIPFREITFLWKNSLYNSQPLIDLVNKNLNLQTIRNSGVKVSVGTTCLYDSNYKSFTQDDNEFIQGVIASSSYPMGLDPVSINNKLYTDGGLRHVIPISEAVKFGADDIDVVICQPEEDSSIYTPNGSITGIDFGLRCLDIMSDQTIESDVKMAQLYNKLVNAGLAPNKKYLNMKIIRPTNNLNFSALDFDHNNIMQMIDIGYQNAKDQYI